MGLKLRNWDFTWLHSEFPCIHSGYSGGGGFKIEWYYVVSASESKNIRLNWIDFDSGVECYNDGTKISVVSATGRKSNKIEFQEK